MMDLPVIPEEGAAVSRETAEQFTLLERLVRKWNPTINLVSKGSLVDIHQRHILDSAQLFALAAGTEGTWCDLGSGGGFPGLVIAILAKNNGCVLNVKLVESDVRKAIFLREAARELGLDVEVINARSEAIAPMAANIVSARALGSLDMLCSHASRHLADDGFALFPKGARYEQEVLEAQRHWTFDLTVHRSITDPDAAVLQLRRICHV